MQCSPCVLRTHRTQHTEPPRRPVCVSSVRPQSPRPQSPRRRRRRCSTTWSKSNRNKRYKCGGRPSSSPLAFTSKRRVPSGAADMKNPAGSPEGRRLALLLDSALLMEARHWKVLLLRGQCIQGTDISLSEHHDVVLWLVDMGRLFHFLPETFALGVCVLNRLLSTVKAQPKYLKCIAFTSLILAAKINEEDEVIGSVKDLVERSGCHFSTAEILRMERTILDKLHWDLYTATPVDFIHIFHALLVSGHPWLFPSMGRGSGSDPDSGAGDHQKSPPGFQVALWTRQVQHCMACHQLWQFKGSTLALAIITLELEALTPDWFSVFTGLLRKAQVESAEFIHCREMTDEYLSSLEFCLPANAVYIFDPAAVQPPLKEGGVVLTEEEEEPSPPWISPQCQGE